MQSSLIRFARRLTCSLLSACLVTAALPTSSQADPPPWAKAHGWRSKHDPSYLGYHGHRWPDDYGILSGRCNRAAIGSVLGGAVGGAIGSTIGTGDGRVVAVVVGTVVGAAIGNEIGRTIDEQDRSCIGHSLELAAVGQTIRWDNPEMGLRYALTPTKDFGYHGRACREFTVRASKGVLAHTVEGKACRADDGSWQLL